MDGINDSNEPGIPGSLFSCRFHGNGVPDWQGFSGVQITDDEGYYSFTG